MFLNEKLVYGPVSRLRIEYVIIPKTFLEEKMKKQNDFPYSDSNKRYHTYDYAMRKQFGKKMARVCLDGGMSCPNLDGKKGTGGCIYCLNGSKAPEGNTELSITDQLRQGIALMQKKWPQAGFIAYFQAHTNTYAPVERLKCLYNEALAVKGIEGLAIATRPDCLSDGVCELLEYFSKKTYFTVELGLQTVHDETGACINRCHTWEDFLLGYEKLQKRGILTGIHLIDGLPGESPDMMIESARKISMLRPYLVKLHLLYVEKGTVLSGWYFDGKYIPMERDAFIQTVCSQLEVLPPDTIIGRLTGDGEAQTLIAPQWIRKKLCVLNDVDKEFIKRDSWQGKFY